MSIQSLAKCWGVSKTAGRLVVVASIFICVVIVGLVPIVLAGPTICSGMVEKTNVKCTTGRPCDITKNEDCLTAITQVADGDKCEKEGAVPADNCVNTTTEMFCAYRIECSKNEAGDACVSGLPLGLVHYFAPTDGGNCTVE